MPENKPRLARLAAILTQLQSKRLVTARAIAYKHEVSIRTVYRDIRTLEKSGVPILTQEGKGYSLMEGYQLPPVLFTEAEAMALITAEQIIRQNKDKSLVENYENAIIKIKSTLKHSQKTKTEFLSSRLQIRNNQQEEKTSQYLIQLQSTIANFQVVKIDYLSLQEQRTQRRIEPFALYTTKGNWILIAFCQVKNAFRAFRLDRIQQLQVLEHHFEPHEMTLEQYLEQCRASCSDTPDTGLSPASFTFATYQKNNTMQNVNVSAFQVIGISIITSNENGQAAQDIGRLWQRFLSEGLMQQIPNKINTNIYSIYTDYTGDHLKPYRTILGCQVAHLDQIPDGMIGRSFTGGNYLQIPAKGNIEQGMVGNKWFEIWGMDLKRSYTADFEIYGEKARNPKDAEVDIFIGVNS